MHEVAAGVKPVAPRAPPKPRLMSGRKPAGKTGGLGVKKMSKQVDESLFDQAPEEQAPARAAVSLPSMLKKLAIAVVAQPWASMHSTLMHSTRTFSA